MNFYISDTHFGHKNCMAFDARCFKDVEEHDQTLIERWNETVGYDDDVYHLGDVSWHNSTRTLEILNQLNGRIHLIKGNHDNKILKNRDIQNRFVEITDYKEINDNGKDIVLCHYPIPCFKNHFYGWYHLYGHVHTSFEYNMMKRCRYEMEELYRKPCNMYNVFCGLFEYKPATLTEIEICQEF